MSESVVSILMHFNKIKVSLLGQGVSRVKSLMSFCIFRNIFFFKIGQTNYIEAHKSAEPALF